MSKDKRLQQLEQQTITPDNMPILPDDILDKIDLSDTRPAVPRPDCLRGIPAIPDDILDGITLITSEDEK